MNRDHQRRTNHAGRACPSVGFTLAELLARQPKPWRRQAQTAFTLIELLVVIAIIALLVSILLPSLSRAQDMAKEVMGLSNLRAWSVPHRMCADDNNNVLPTPSSTWTVVWHQIVMDAGYCEDPGRYVCPAMPIVEGLHTATYAPNACLWSMFKRNSGEVWIIEGRLDDCVARPETQIVMAERRHVFGSWACSASYWHTTSDNSDVAFLHRGSGNFLLLDGHAEWIEDTGIHGVGPTWWTDHNKYWDPRI